MRERQVLGSGGNRVPDHDGSCLLRTCLNMEIKVYKIQNVKSPIDLNMIGPSSA